MTGERRRSISIAHFGPSSPTTSTTDCRLADAQVSAGEGQQALQTVQAMRQLRPLRATTLELIWRKRLPRSHCLTSNMRSPSSLRREARPTGKARAS